MQPGGYIGLIAVLCRQQQTKGPARSYRKLHALQRFRSDCRWATPLIRGLDSDHPVCQHAKIRCLNYRR
jgi:hypothetical protein